MTKREFERRQRQDNTLRGLGFTQAEADALLRISMTLRRWHELECGTDNGCIERGHMEKNPETGKREFISDENGRPHWANHAGDRPTYYPMADRETGARKRLAAIVAARNDREADYPHRHGGGPMVTYIQTDPRGAALYILRPGDVPAGEDPGAYYSRGICVY